MANGLAFFDRQSRDVLNINNRTITPTEQQTLIFANRCE